MVNFDAETLGFWINAFFVLAAVSTVIAVTAVATVLRRPAPGRRVALELLPSVAPAHATPSTHIREQARRAA